jgi:IS30 family transposase
VQAHAVSVERLLQRRYRPLASKDTERVINALISNARKLLQALYKSLTWDRGKEMADHRRFTLVARQLNERPAKTLNDETPAQRFHECVASTD